MVLAHYLLGASVKTEATVTGIAINLSRPHLAVVGLWVVWAWALWRYLQRAYELLSVVRLEFAADIDAEDRRLAIKRARRYAAKWARSGKIGDELRDVRVDPRTVVFQKSIKLVMLERTGENKVKPRTEAEPDYVVTRDGGREYPRVGGALSGRGKAGEVTVQTFIHSMQWSRRLTIWHRVIATVHAMVRLPAVTDHAAPLILAACALAAPLIEWWVLSP